MSISRRDFGKTLGLAGAAHMAPPLPASSAPAPDVEVQEAGARSGASAYTFFTPGEAAFVEAAVARLIPADELGPGAREAGVAFFIDRQLSGAYGHGAKWYMRGPWGDSVPEQGYQLPLTPRELYRLAIDAIDREALTRHEKPFTQVSAAEQDGLLTAVERGELKAGDTPLKTFFDMLLGNTMEGYFSDPIHGGNRDKVGWRLVGFPGVAASYVNRIEKHNEPYRVEPVGIADVLERRVRQDEHGHVLHEPLDR